MAPKLLKWIRPEETPAREVDSAHVAAAAVHLDELVESSNPRMLLSAIVQAAAQFTPRETRDEVVAVPTVFLDVERFGGGKR